MSYLQRYFPYLLLVVLSLLILMLVYVTAVDIPYGDDWTLIRFLNLLQNQELTFGELWKSYQGHHITAGLLIIIPLAVATNANLIFFQLLNVVVAAVICGIGLKAVSVYWKHSRSSLCKQSLIYLSFVTAAFFMLSLAQVRNYLWAWQILELMCVLSAMMAIFMASKYGNNANWYQTLGILASAIISTFSFGIGIVVWPTLAALLIIQKRNAKQRTLLPIVLIMGVFIYFAYFIGFETSYPDPVWRTHFISIPGDLLRNPALLINYPLFLGNILGYPLLPARYLAACTLGLLSMGLYIYLVWQWLKHNSKWDAQNWSMVFLIGMGMFSILSCCIVCLGRAPMFGSPDYWASGAQGRYCSFNYFHYVAIIFLAIDLFDSFAIIPILRKHGSTIFQVVMIALCFLIIARSIRNYYGVTKRFPEIKKMMVEHESGQNVGKSEQYNEFLGEKSVSLPGLEFIKENNLSYYRTRHERLDNRQ